MSVVVLARVDGWEQHGACPSVKLSGHEPDWQNDGEEVSEEKEYALSRVLDLYRVEMHVELWAKVAIPSSVDVFKMDPSGLLVEAVRSWVRSGPVATASTSDCRARAEGAVEHRSGS